jgi:hypothetical protein
LAAREEEQVFRQALGLLDAGRKLPTRSGRDRFVMAWASLQLAASLFGEAGEAEDLTLPEAEAARRWRALLNPKGLAEPSGVGPADGGAVRHVWSPQTLRAAVEEPAVTTLWIHCRLEELAAETSVSLRKWVSSGKRVVLENDVGSLFGYTLIDHWPYPIQGRLANERLTHPLIAGVREVVSSSGGVGGLGGWVTTAHPTGLPLIVGTTLAGTPVSLLAVAKYGKGEALFACPGIVAKQRDGAVLLDNLQTYVGIQPQTTAGKPEGTPEEAR